ncbi:MAG: Dyp-type peroxidase [Ferruginibacter sp.]
MKTEPYLEIDEIQGNILPGFRMPNQHLIGCKIASLVNLSGFLTYILPLITTMREALSYKEERVSLAKQLNIRGIASFQLPVQQDLFWINMGFGNKLLRKLTTDADNADNSFKVGLAARSQLLGDSSDPLNEGNKKNWIVGNEQNEADLFFITASDNAPNLKDRTSELKAKLSEFDIKIIYEETGGRLEGDKEHFGFKDGISQPSIRGYTDEDKTIPLTERNVFKGNDDPTGAEYAAPGKMLIWPGQFVFGYDKQSPDHFRTPENPSEIEKKPFLKNGSFLIFRSLKQDVESFYGSTHVMYEQLNATEGFRHIDYNTFLAKVVGRFKNGQPVVWTEQNRSQDDFNNFNFNANTPEFTLSDGTVIHPVRSDQQGLKCPAFAHIRKVNPRDLPTDLGKETDSVTFRIIRRGIPFGKPYNYADKHDPINRAERGLLFLSYQTSIERQFERLVSKWINEPSRPTNMGYDILVGQNGEEDENGVKWCRFINEFGQTKELKLEKSFVTPTGGGYFFCPSINTIKSIIQILHNPVV